MGSSMDPGFRTFRSCLVISAADAGLLTGGQIPGDDDTRCDLGILQEGE